MKPIEEDGRKLWLDEALQHSTTFLNRLIHTESKRELQPQEKTLKDVAAAYLYLYNIIEEQNLLEETENFFDKQTIH
tara:strand:+ start:1189 stop:1419 length:231 start_codon:yes stop_codon:yes gene_type:complete